MQSFDSSLFDISFNFRDHSHNCLYQFLFSFSIVCGGGVCNTSHYMYVCSLNCAWPFFILSSLIFFDRISHIFRLDISHSINKCCVFSVWAHKEHPHPPPSIPLFASTKLPFLDVNICLFIIKKAVSFVLEGMSRHMIFWYPLKLFKGREGIPLLSPCEVP